MAFQLAVAGVIPEDPKIVQRVSEQLGVLRSRLQGDLRILIGPAYTDSNWQSLIGGEGFPILGFHKRGDSDGFEGCMQRVYEDTPLRSVVGEAMCSCADLVLMVWNEDVTEFSGASWELLHIAHKEKTPCLWISSATGNVYWSLGSYYEKCNTATLDALCNTYRNAEIKPQEGTKKRIPLLPLGIALRNSFLNRHRAMKPETEPVIDRVLQDDFSMEKEEAGSESVRQIILGHFKRFDQNAIELNAQYQSVLYWRAVLPFLATAFLAVGFYAETVLSVTGMPADFRSWLAGIGFLIHGLLNLYVFFLARNKAVGEKHNAFLQNRYIAEVLRLLIHFVPYGIYTNLRKICDNNDKTRAAIQSMTLGDEPEVQQVNQKSILLVIGHVREMLKDQIAYHEESAERYRRIVERLDKWYKCIFTVGFVTVILRAVFQFYVSLFPLQGSINGVELNGYTRSFANMLALLLPAWASYFASKASLCNFRYNCDNHTRMAKEFSQILVQVEMIQGIQEDVPVEILNTLCEELADVMIVGDTLAWERKYQGSTITNL